MVGSENGVPLLAGSVNTPSLEPRGSLLISKLPFPKRDFQQNDLPVSANSVEKLTYSAILIKLCQLDQSNPLFLLNVELARTHEGLRKGVFQQNRPIPPIRLHKSRTTA